MIRLLILNSSVQNDDLTQLINKNYLNFEFDYFDDTYFLIPESLSKDELEISLIKNGNEISRISAYLIEQDEDGNNLYDVYIDDKVEESVDFGVVDTLVSNWLYDFFHEIKFSEEYEQESFDKGAYIFDISKFLELACQDINNQPSREASQETYIHYYNLCIQQPRIISFCKELVLEALASYCEEKSTIPIRKNGKSTTELHREFSEGILTLSVTEANQTLETLELSTDELKIAVSFPEPDVLDFEEGCVYLVLLRSGSDARFKLDIYSNFCAVFDGRFRTLFAIERILLDLE